MMREYFNECARKYIHKTKKEAKSEAKRLKISQEYKNKSGAPLTIYKCRFCKNWHLGHRRRKGVDD
jgi:hypothetical protein